MLPMLPTPRPVEEQWKCKRSGDCCTKPAEVVMTKREASILVLHAPPTIQMQFRQIDDKFVALKAAPCPLYVFGSCLVYAVRPYNCRRFACMRPDPKTEPFEVNDGNWKDRLLTSRSARRQLMNIQRKAQRWADRMGWL